MVVRLDVTDAATVFARIRSHQPADAHGVLDRVPR
jgi:hypothetical protein